MTYLHSDKNGRKHEGSDWDFELCLSGSLQSELLIGPHEMQISKMITLAGLLTCLFQEIVIKGQIMKDQIRTKSWFIWVSGLNQRELSSSINQIPYFILLS